MFSQSVIEQIGYYVYFLRDPIKNEVFYVGKGIGNRVFEHVSCALVEPTESEKFERIRAIEKSGNSVQHFMLRHGLTESMAFEVEAAVIDFVGISNLVNLQSGHYSTDFGIKTTDEVIAMYSAPLFATDEPVLLININKRFNREVTVDELYEATRKSWVVGNRRNKAKFAVATYRGLTREVYQINEWYQIDERWGFNGQLADEAIRTNLRYKSISEISERGAANPIRYFNC
ncbi:MAG: hypothetical protein RIS87_1357 [Pseudomonadota bacterium]